MAVQALAEETAGIGEGEGAITSGAGVRTGTTILTFGSAVNLPVMEKFESWAFSTKMVLIREGTWRAVEHWRLFV